VLGCDFGRIQFTPDLMPSDITGTSVFNLSEKAFMLVKGPIFTTFLLADEINRAPAKTQAALLQAMQERVVTIDRQTIPLPSNFTVFATQNPIEYEGTYPLPEAQKDRFMLKIKMNYPTREEETLLAQRMLGTDSPERSLAGGSIQPVLTAERLTQFRELLQKVTVRPELVGYIIDIIRSTRKHESVLVGAGPRATQSLLLAARANALLSDRDYVSPDDIKALAAPVLEHRLVLRPEFEIEGQTVAEAIESVLREVTVPR
jgi:MoxR-like ATPase